MIEINYRNIILLILAALVLAVLTGVITSVSAIRIEQGDQSNPNAIAYLGETVDISLALTWPDFKIAYCSNGYAGCDPPNQIITIAGFQHSYLISEDVFHVGQYYRWSGTWNRGENQLAFYVKDGKRPSVNETPTLTPTPTIEPGIDTRGNGPFHYLITRGDSPTIYAHFAKDSEVCGDGQNQYDGYFWIFGVSSLKLNAKMFRDGDDYTYPMTEAATAALTTGSYTGYLQFTGKNGLQDVFTSFDGKFLDSPYDDKVVPNVPIDPTCNTETPSSIKNKFETIVKSAKYSDDILIPITMTVKEPDIVITNIVQDDTHLWVTGRTTWCNGTEIVFKLDPDNYALKQDVNSHTWTTKVTGDITRERTFEITIPYYYDDLYIGVHELKMTVDKNGYTTDMFHNFRISGIYVTPVPTPEFRKIMLDMNGSVFTMTTTVVPTTPTPAPTYNASTNTSVVNITPIETRMASLNTTVNVTPTPQIVIGGNATPVKTPDGNIHVPLSPVVSLIAVPIAFGFFWWRMRE